MRSAFSMATSAFARARPARRRYATTSRRLKPRSDTIGLDVGDYQLTLRREGGEWQMFHCICGDECRRTIASTIQPRSPLSP